MSRDFIRAILYLFIVVFALVVHNPYLNAVLFLAMIYFDKGMILPTLILVPIIEAAYPKGTLTLEFLIVLGLIPIIIRDVLLKKSGLRLFSSDTTSIFLGFTALLILGFIVVLTSYGGSIDLGATLGNVTIKLFKLTMFLLIGLLLLNTDRSKFNRGMDFIVNYNATISLLILAYIIFYGSKKASGLLNFGDSSHGEFTACIVALASFNFISIPLDKSRVGKLWRLLGIGATLAIVFLTGSRNGLVSFIFIIGIYIVLSYRDQIVLMSMGVLSSIFISIMLFFGGVFEIEYDGFNRKYNKLSKDKESSEVSALAEASTGRTILWVTGVKGFLESPLIGKGGDEKVTREYMENQVNISNIAHNTPIEVAIQYGIIGVFFYFRMIWLVFKRILQYDSSRLGVKAVYLMPFFAFLSLVFSSQFISWIWGSLYWYLFIISMVIVERKYIEEEPNQEYELS